MSARLASSVVLASGLLVAGGAACGTSSAPQADAGGGDAAAMDGSADARTADAADAGPSCDVPTSATPLFAYLKSGAYKSFAAESLVHATVSPHGDVRAYLNPTLEASMKAGNPEHPICSAVVKELYDPDKTTLKGWVVWVKLQLGKPGGQGFYWYEVQSTTNGTKPAADGIGVQPCAACHSGGKDYLLLTWPLK
jgi:hypothetical protein